MSTVVLDASAGAEIAVRTVLGRRLLALVPWAEPGGPPDHFHLEAGGRRAPHGAQRVDHDARARSALDRLLSQPVTVARSRPLLPEAWTLRHNLIVQDAVWLARHLDAPLLTGDRRLANAPRLPVQVLHTSSTS